MAKQSALERATKKLIKKSGITKATGLDTVAKIKREMSRKHTAAGIIGLDRVLKELQDINKKAEMVCQRTVSDVATRAPGWIAQGAADRYAIKKNSITGQKVGNVDVKTTATNGGAYHGFRATITYTGRRLTPARFTMKPAAPPPGRAGYTLKAEIRKGQSKQLGKVKKLTRKQWYNIGRNFTHQGTRNSPVSPWMLQPTGNKRADGIPYIPFQRVKQPGNMTEVMRTISLPQMVTQGKNGPMHPEVEKHVMEGLEKRLENHLKLLK